MTTFTSSTRGGRRLAVGAVAAAMLAAGCGASRASVFDRDPAPRRTTPLSTTEQSETERLAQQAETAWGQRAQEPQLRAAIRAWSRIVEINPGDHETWVRLSRAYYLHADGFIFFDEARQSELMPTHQRGMEAAEHALDALSGEFGTRRRAGTRMEEAITVLEAPAVPALYWYAANLGRWASADGFATILERKDEIRAVMQKCLEMQPEYFYRAPDRYFGAFYARAPSFAGGDLNKSREHFQRALQAAPNYFANHRIFAEEYAVKAQDRALFERELNWVLQHEPSLEPPVEPENAIEVRKARLLLGRADELFE